LATKPPLFEPGSSIAKKEKKKEEEEEKEKTFCTFSISSTSCFLFFLM